MVGHLFLIDRGFLDLWLVIGSQFCAQFFQPRLTRASSGRSNPIVRSPLEHGCPRVERERERGGFEMKGRGNPISFFDLFGSGVLGFIPLAFFSIVIFRCQIYI